MRNVSANCTYLRICRARGANCGSHFRGGSHHAQIVFFSSFFLRKRPRSMDSPGQSAIDIKEFASRIVALEALGKPAKSPVPRVTGPEICALVYRAPMYRERLGGIKGMRPAESLEPISLSRGRPSSTCRAISRSGLSAPQDQVGGLLTEQSGPCLT